MPTLFISGTYLTGKGTLAQGTGSLLLQAPVQSHQQILLPDRYIYIHTDTYMYPMSELAPLLPLTSHLRIHFTQAVLQLYSIAVLQQTYGVSANSPPSLPTGF